MRRLGLGLSLAVCALAGALAAVLLAGTVSAAVGTGTDTTATATTDTTTTTTPAVLADGVTVGGVEVGGLAPDAAFAIVRTAFESPLVLTVAGHTLQPTPVELGAIAYVQNAIARARTAPPGTAIPLTVRVDGAKVRAYVGKLAKRFDRAPQDARVVLRRLRPFVSKDVPGRTLDRPKATAAIVGALRANARFPLELRFRARPASVTRRTIGPIVVIRRSSNRLSLYEGVRLRRAFRVATGSDRYPTPLGRFRVIAMWKNPWWYPPDSDWAQGEKPIPPGPGNPLGTRWMGISSPGVGIHGTPDAASLGYSVSHGCIRMAIPEAEWLFERLKVGATVFIVRA
ncbi:MAG: L,D-transpeptidase family protein [Pseudomonadota bacterium]